MQYYLNNEWHNIDENIDYSFGVQTTTRIDDSFETCTFKAYLTEENPIPPYTFFLDGSVQWVGESKVTKYLTETNLYVHEFSLLEPIAFFKCFIIGVKVYSKESPTWGQDVEKVKSLLDQAKRMYPDYKFDYGNSINNRILTSKTYTFNATDTLYDCLNQICQENDCKLYLEFEDNDPTWLKVKAKAIVSGFYDLSDSRIQEYITDLTISQDAENYGRYLETYASNVVDRTTITRCEGLELKAADAMLNRDTAFIELPTPIELIEDFGVHQQYETKMEFTNLSQYFPDESEFYDLSTYGDFTNLIARVNNQNVYFFDEYYERYIKKYAPYISKSDFYSYVTVSTIQSDWGASPYYGRIVFIIPTTCKMLLPTPQIKEKTEWDILTPQDQTGYAVYTTGSNKITNLNATYKIGIWEQIAGLTRLNFLTFFQTSGTYYYGNAQMFFDYDSDIAGDADIFHWQYFAFYHAITNPYLRNTKSQTAENEPDFKPISRSYGVSANYIDFDKITPNMAISNNTLGQIERVYEIDLTDVNVVGLDNPKAGNVVQLTPNSTTYWYISSCIRTKKFYGGKDTAVLTIVRNYSKKADAIGVDSQAETTNNPLKGITTRPIYLEATLPHSIETLVKKNLVLRIRFYDVNDNVITNGGFSGMYTRCSVQAYGNELILYCEALDQIIFMFARGGELLSGSGTYEQIPCKYTSDNAECGYIEVEVDEMTPATNQTTGVWFPSGNNGNFNALLYFASRKIDKDAREHLTFTVKIKSSANN